MCVVDFYQLGSLLGRFLHIILVIYSGYFFNLVTHTHRPIPTHPLCKGFALTRNASPRNIGGWWVVLVGQHSQIPVQKLLHFGDPDKSNNMLHFYFFITQSGSCTLRPRRLVLCCFPLHWRQISPGITSSPLSSTATKTQISEGLMTEQVGVPLSQWRYVTKKRASHLSRTYCRRHPH